MNPDKSTLKYQRNHTFSKRPSLAQVCGMLIFLIQALIFYIYIIGTYQNNSLKISMISIFTISLAGLLIFSIITGQIDSTDEILIASKNACIDTIRNLESLTLRICKSCQCAVKQTSRHCSQCQQCCEQLDHHCIWLNTCIGHKNYKAFIVTTTFAFSTLAIYLLSLSLLTEQLSRTTMQFKCFGFVIAWIIGLVVVVFMVLIFNLILFHIYLNCNQISTYEFILMKALTKNSGNAIIPSTNEVANQYGQPQNNQIDQPIQLDRLIQRTHRTHQLPPIQHQIQHQMQLPMQPQIQQNLTILSNDVRRNVFQSNESQNIIMPQNESTKIKSESYQYSSFSQPLTLTNICNSQPLKQPALINTSYECKSQTNNINQNYASILKKINNKKDQLSAFFSKNPSLNLFLGSKQCKQSVDEMITILNSRKSRQEQKDRQEQNIINI